MVAIDIAVYPDRAATIRAGLDPATTTITVDLDAITPDERDLLADHAGSPIPVATPTVKDLFQALRDAAAEERARREQLLGVYADALRERRTTTRREQITPGGVGYDVIRPDWPISRSLFGRTHDPNLLFRYRDEIREITEGDEATTWINEIEKINHAARQRALTEQRQADEATARERDEAVERLRVWARDHGSERVRLLIEEDYPSWHDIAEGEFYIAHTPNGFTPLTGDHVVMTLPAPEPADIHALRQARQIVAAEECLGDPKLVRVFLDAAHETAHPALQLTITGPHGGHRIVWHPVHADPALDPAAAEGPPT